MNDHLSANIQKPGKAHAHDWHRQAVMLDEIFILHPSAFILAFHAASQETSQLRQFQLALRRAGEAKDEDTKQANRFSFLEQAT